MNASQAYWTGFGDNPAVRDHDFSKLRQFYTDHRPRPTSLSAMPSDRFDSRGSSETSSGPETCPQRRTAVARHVIRHRRSSHIGKHDRHVFMEDTPASLFFMRKSLFHSDMIPACVCTCFASCADFVNIAYFSRYAFSFTLIRTCTHEHALTHAQTRTLFSKLVLSP